MRPVNKWMRSQCLKSSGIVWASRSVFTRAVREGSRAQRGSSRRQQQLQQRQQSKPGELSYLVTCHPGLQEVTAAELQQPFMQASNVQAVAPGRVTFTATSPAAGYTAALCLRSATRVLQLIHQQQLDPDRAAGDTVYEATRAAAAWEELLQPAQTLAVHCLHFFNNSNVTNSQLVGRRVRDAVCDAVRDARGVRPAPPDGCPDLPLVFQMLSDRLQLFRDLGAGSLHRRGYRSDAAVHKAALNESAAAGLLLLADWHKVSEQPGAVLADPMCGSGTFLIEAALIATKTAPGLLRLGSRADQPHRQHHAPQLAWPFEGWHDYQHQQWKEVVAAARERSEQGLQQWKQLHGQLLGNDMHQGALQLAQQAAAAAGVSGLIQFHRGPCGAWRPLAQPQMVVANPPWGVRLLGDPPPGPLDSPAAGNGARGSSSSRRRRGDAISNPQQQHVSLLKHAGGGGRVGGADDEDELADTWLQLSQFLKQQCPGADAWVLSGNAQVTSHLGMRSCRKRAISIGGLKTAWLKYEVRQQQQQGQQQQQEQGQGQGQGQQGQWEANSSSSSSGGGSSRSRGSRRST